MKISLEGKRVFITAGAAGMGRATALAMQAKYGDYSKRIHLPGHLQNDRLLPNRCEI